MKFRAIRNNVLLLALVTAAIGFPHVLCHAQLTVLSEGNLDESWRTTQIATLDSQLSQFKPGDPKFADISVELRAQKRWLESWTPGALGDAAILQAAKVKRGPDEPVLDPSGKAADLRERLFGEDAKPTVEDTRELQQSLIENPSDIGLRQLHLHWLDQLQYRKQYADEIAAAALDLQSRLDRDSARSDEVELALQHVMYRRARALAYRTLPDVIAEAPIEDEAAHNSALLGAYGQLMARAGRGRPEFILIEIRMLRRDGWNGLALVLLESYEPFISRKWFLKKRRDILQDLGWQHPAEEAATQFATDYPDEKEVKSSGNIGKASSS